MSTDVLGIDRAEMAGRGCFDLGTPCECGEGVNHLSDGTWADVADQLPSALAACICRKLGRSAS